MKQTNKFEHTKGTSIQLFQKRLSERMANAECRTEVARLKGTVVTLFDMQNQGASTLRENEYTNFERLSEGS